MSILKHINFILLSIITISCNQKSNQEKNNTMNEKLEQEAIYQELDHFVEAWNRGDAKAAASFYTEDGTRVGAMGDIQHGRKELEMAFDTLLNKKMVGAKAKQEKGTIRILTPELAIWQGGLEIYMPGDSTSIKGYVVQVMKKVNGKWFVLEGHPKLFPQSK